MAGIYERAITENMVTTEDGDYVTILEWIKQNIDADPTRSFTLDLKYLRKILGPEVRKKNDYTIYVSVTSTLKKYDIYTKRKMDSDGSIKITMIPLHDDNIANL